jgi:nicotinic acid mononucleotide adenylyltransferase
MILFKLKLMGSSNNRQNNKKNEENKNSKENVGKNEENNEDKSEEEYYEEIIKELNTNVDKMKNNIKKCNKKDKLIVLIESGALAPPHKMHIGLMEKTKKFIEENNKKAKVICGYLIPSSDQYVKYKLKEDFINLEHRVNMTKLMVKNSEWLEYLDWGFAYGEEIKDILDRIIKKEFPKYKIKSYLVFGIDYYMRHRIPLNDEHICIYRPGYDIDKAKEMYPNNLIFVEGNEEDVSSTILRKAIREKDEKIINELTSKEVVDYIKNNDIFAN